MKKFLLLFILFPLAALGQEKAFTYVIPQKLNPIIYKDYETLEHAEPLYPGDTILLIGYTGEFWQIKFNGNFNRDPMEGYIMSYFIPQDYLGREDLISRFLIEHNAKLSQRSREKEEREKIALAKARSDNEALKAELAKLEKQLLAKYTKLYGSGIAKRLLNNELWIGMTKQMAIHSIGKPSNINRTLTKAGESDQWVYSSQYLYFTNGKLTAIQKSL